MNSKMFQKTAAENIFGFSGVLFPKKMPNAQVLNFITNPPPSSHFQPLNNRKPRVSLHMQSRIREACLIAGIDPVAVVGLPEIPSKRELSKQLPETFFLPVGYQQEMKRYKKQLRIEENMRNMDDRIKQWKLGRQKIKESSRPELPF